MTEELDLLLTVDQVAKLLKVAPGTVYRFLSQGRLPRVKLGSRSVRIHRDDLLAFIEERKTKGQVTNEGDLP